MVICHKDNLKGTRDLNSDMLFENLDDMKVSFTSINKDIVRFARTLIIMVAIRHKGGTLPKVIAALRKASDTDIVKVASKIAAMEDPLNLHS